MQGRLAERGLPVPLYEAGEAQEEIRSDVAGIDIGRSNLSLVYRGDALFHLATIDASESLDSAVEAIETGSSEEEFNTEELI